MTPEVQFRFCQISNAASFPEGFIFVLRLVQHQVGSMP